MIVLTVGVYVVLWGKHVDDDGEARCSQDNTILEAVKCCSGNNGVSIMPKINETNEDVETGKLKPEENESPVVVVVFGCENVDNISWCKYMAFFFVRGKVGRSVTSF